MACNPGRGLFEVEREHPVAPLKQTYRRSMPDTGRGAGENVSMLEDHASTSLTSNVDEGDGASTTLREPLLAGNGSGCSRGPRLDFPHAPAGVPVWARGTQSDLADANTSRQGHRTQCHRTEALAARAHVQAQREGHLRTLP